jgi:general secretion pathway protein K
MEVLIKMRYKHNGISLIVVLWMLVILTVIALAFSRQVRTEIQLTANYQNQAKAEALAEAGVWRAVMMLSQRSAAALSGEVIYLDGRLYPLASDVGDLKVSLQSSQGLIDLNRAPEELINSVVQKVAESIEQAETVTAALFDWRDEDDLRRLGGAERSDYLADNLGYGPTNGPLISVAELARVYGMTTKMYRALRPYVTVISGNARIDVTTAPSFVLSALPGMSESLKSSILAARLVDAAAVDLTTLPDTTRQYIGANQATSVRISSLAQAGQVMAGIIAEVEMRTDGEKPVVVLSWQFGIDEVFKDDGIKNAF